MVCSWSPNPSEGCRWCVRARGWAGLSLLVLPPPRVGTQTTHIFLRFAKHFPSTKSVVSLLSMLPWGGVWNPRTAPPCFPANGSGSHRAFLMHSPEFTFSALPVLNFYNQKIKVRNDPHHHLCSVCDSRQGEWDPGQGRKELGIGHLQPLFTCLGMCSQ